MALSCGINAENKRKASAGVYDGFGIMRKIFSIKFNCSANKKIISTYNNETIKMSAVKNGVSR